LGKCLRCYPPLGSSVKRLNLGEKGFFEVSTCVEKGLCICQSLTTSKHKGKKTYNTGIGMKKPRIQSKEKRRDNAAELTGDKIQEKGRKKNPRGNETPAEKGLQGKKNCKIQEEGRENRKATHREVCSRLLKEGVRKGVQGGPQGQGEERPWGTQREKKEVQLTCSLFLPGKRAKPRRKEHEGEFRANSSGEAVCLPDRMAFPSSRQVR